MVDEEGKALLHPKPTTTDERSGSCWKKKKISQVASDAGRKPRNWKGGRGKKKKKGRRGVTQESHILEMKKKFQGGQLPRTTVQVTQRPRFPTTGGGLRKEGRGRGGSESKKASKAGFVGTRTAGGEQGHRRKGELKKTGNESFFRAALTRRLDGGKERQKGKGETTDVGYTVFSQP